MRLLALAAVTIAITACSSGSAPVQGASSSPSASSRPSGASPSPITCRPGNPLAGVWGPDRLVLKSDCREARGVVLASLHETDGDYHIWLEPDRGYEELLNSENHFAGKAALVLEIIPACKGEPETPAAAASCPSSNIRPPANGAHIQVFGPWVLDSNHGWNEIHPVEVLNLLSP
jgi:hypothetical protein